MEQTKPAHRACNEEEVSSLRKQIDDLKAQLAKIADDARCEALDDAWAVVQVHWPTGAGMQSPRTICDAILDLKTRKMP